VIEPLNIWMFPIIGFALLLFLTSGERDRPIEAG
jgi:hypothetical protein